MKTTLFLRKILLNLPGWRTKRKILVIESDDWGSVRIASRQAYDALLKAGLPVEKSYFVKNDCLERNTDLVALFEVLSRFKDINGHFAVITADAVVANPDFKKIADSGKTQYHYQLITDTYKSNPQHDQVMDLWFKHGIGENMLYPQYHGREHVNVRNWMKAINSGSKAEELAFNLNTLLNLKVPGDNDHVKSYMAAFEYADEAHKTEIETITTDGLNRFKEVFGFPSTTFVASSSIIGEHMNKILYDNGVRFNQCGRHFIPTGNGNVKLVHKFWGDKSDGITYWRRNATFEPSRNPDYDWVNNCMKEIQAAFMAGKPAVINSHRVNYSGGIFQENRDNTLRLLGDLLKAVQKRWPNVEFMNSEQLGKLMSETLK